MKKNYKERRHVKPRVRGPSQTPGRMGWEAFVDWALSQKAEPVSYPAGYNERKYLRAIGVKTGLVSRIANPGRDGERMLRRVRA